MDILASDQQGALPLKGDAIDLLQPPEELPAISDQARIFFKVAGDPHSSFELLAEESRQLLAESTSRTSTECATLAGNLFMQEDLGVKGNRPGLAIEVPWLRASAVCDLVCFAAIGPDGSLSIPEAAALLRAALDVSVSLCDDSDFALAVLYEFVEDTIDHYLGVVNHANWARDTETYVQGQSALARVYEVLSAAGLAKQQAGA